MPNSKDDQKETIKPAEAGTGGGPNGEGGAVSPPKTPLADYSIPKKEVTEKKKLTAAERKKLAELRRREKEEEKKRKEKPESSSDDESTEALKKKIKFYQDKAETAEGEAYEAVKEKEKSEKMYQDQLAKRKNQAAELKEKLKETLKEKKKDEEESEEEDSLSDQLQSEDSDSLESESSPEIIKKKKKKEEITEMDRRNSKVCAFDPCERQENCGFVHVKAGRVPKDDNNEPNPNYIYRRRDLESETCETAEERKECDGERRLLRRPEEYCERSCQEGGKGSHEGDKEDEEEIEERVLPIIHNDVLCNKIFKPNDSTTYFSDTLRWGLKGSKGIKEIRKLIHECDDLINDLDSDLVLARLGLMGSKRKKRSKNKEVRELIRDCDEFISSLESDLALARREQKGSKCNKRSKYNKEVRQLIRECEDLIKDLDTDLSIENTSRRVNKCKYNDVNKEFRAECTELVQGIYFDVLTIKLKNPFKQKKKYTEKMR